MAPVEKSSSLTCSLREQKHSQWEFPDWIPVAHRWMCLSDSEAAPYLPAEEKSPLFSIQREGIKDDGALYRLNRCVMGCPQAQQGVGCQAVPCRGSGCQVVPRPSGTVVVRVSSGLSGTSGYPQGCVHELGSQPILCPGVPPAPAPALQKPSPPSPQQVQLSAAPPRAPGCLLLRGWPSVGDGVVPNPRGLCSPAVCGRVLPQEHGGDTQRVWASLRPCTPAALGPGCAADGAGVSGQAWGWGLPRSCVPLWLSGW